MQKSGQDPFQPKITRNDRFAQMTHQEKIIEQKKREILEKLEATNKNTSFVGQDKTDKSSNLTLLPKKTSSSLPRIGVYNTFNNDGSFLKQFKSIKDKRIDSKLKSFKSREGSSDERNKISRWSQRGRSPSPKKEHGTRPKLNRFSDKSSTNEPKITINTSFNSSLMQQNYNNFRVSQPQIMSQNVTGQPLMKNVAATPLTTSSISYVSMPQSEMQVIVSQPVLINIPQSQVVTEEITNSVMLSDGNILVSSANVTLQPTILSTVSLPSNSIISHQMLPQVATVELESIPPPNPIQVQNIPQPEPLNTLSIPQPAPLQVQNIPTPKSLQLNEIPNPKPLDLMAIPTPNDDNICNAEYLTNIPPPNKTVPPPKIESNINLPGFSNCLPLLQQTQITVNNIGTNQEIVLPLQNVPSQNISLQTFSLTNIPMSVALAGSSTIPSLMAQPVLPPPGMTINNPIHVNLSCPPPMLPAQQMTPFGNHPSGSNFLPPMNTPPPLVHQINTSLMNDSRCTRSLKNTSIDTVIPPGTAEYEAMVSLARMVAQCGPCIEDEVQERKTQDPSLWFLFHKESGAYAQYKRLVEQMKKELDSQEDLNNVYKPEEIYDPDTPTDEEVKDPTKESLKRKRKSRWGEKEKNLPAALEAENASTACFSILSEKPQQVFSQQGNMGLSKVTRSDPRLVQYAIQTFGINNPTEEQWKKAEDHFKINLLYQDMVQKRDEAERLSNVNRKKYEYDSDEDTEGGTWEHKVREKEMVATELWAQELTRQSEGKHHIGDFLPPEEFKRFMEKTNANKEGQTLNFSDYKEFKIKEDNIGFKMLQKLGWTKGEGLGSQSNGITEPINKVATIEQQGLGLNSETDAEDEYDSYRKRMMLAYRFRPNPLNNPRRSYY